MRKTTIVAVLGLALTTLLPAPVRAVQGEEEIQLVGGTIKLPTRYLDRSDPQNPKIDQGYPGLVRRAYLISAETNGLVGYVFPVEPETVMGRFTLTVDSQSSTPGDADLGIYFYDHLGDIGSGLGLIGGSLPTNTAVYDVTAAGGETGFVAPGSRYALVFMKSGLDVQFTYTAFSPMNVEIMDLGYAPPEVTVGRGGWVRWTNVDQEFHSVTATDGAFDSSPSMKRPLRPDDQFAVQFVELGDYTYRDKFGTATGVVHVVAGPGPGTPPPTS